MFIDAKILQLGYYFKVTIFWNVTWCNLVYTYTHVVEEHSTSIFRVGSYLSNRLDGVTSQKTVMLIVTTRGTSNLTRYSI